MKSEEHLPPEKKEEETGDVAQEEVQQGSKGTSSNTPGDHDRLLPEDDEAASTRPAATLRRTSSTTITSRIYSVVDLGGSEICQSKGLTSGAELRKAAARARKVRPEHVSLLIEGSTDLLQDSDNLEEVTLLASSQQDHEISIENTIEVAGGEDADEAPKSLVHLIVDSEKVHWMKKLSRALSRANKKKKKAALRAGRQAAEPDSAAVASTASSYSSSCTSSSIDSLSSSRLFLSDSSSKTSSRCCPDISFDTFNSLNHLPDVDQDELQDDQAFYENYMSEEQMQIRSSENTTAASSNPPPVLSYWSAVLEDLPQRLRSDRPIMHLAIKLNSFHGLQIADPSLQDDAKLVLLAVRQNPEALSFASTRVKKMKSVVLEAVRKNAYALLYFADESLLNDFDLNLAAVKADGFYLRDVPEECHQNKNFVLTAVRQNPLAFRFVPDSLLDDPEVRRAAFVPPPSEMMSMGQRRLGANRQGQAPRTAKGYGKTGTAGGTTRNFHSCSASSEQSKAELSARAGQPQSSRRRTISTATESVRANPKSARTSSSPSSRASASGKTRHSDYVFEPRAIAPAMTPSSSSSSPGSGYPAYTPAPRHRKMTAPNTSRSQTSSSYNNTNDVSTHTAKTSTVRQNYRHLVRRAYTGYHANVI
ncbi:unnamed protein product [Amoebophrya sp. A25]|nr:unnamed protein product [Amoebophrya sp. A25]|eukprot:GSA25T00021815001.1